MNIAARKSSYQIEETTFEVLYADITTMSTDVIVSSDDSFLSMSGGVSRAIRNAAGESIKDEINKHIPMKLGEVAVTSSGNLNTKYIFHGVTIDLDKWEFASAEQITALVKKSLNLAEALGLSSISFPALGTGVARFPFQLAAKTMMTAIGSYLEQPTKLQRINLCLYSKNSLTDLKINTFYEQASALAAIYAQTNRLDYLLEEVKELLVKVGKTNLLNDISILQKKISLSNEAIAGHQPDKDMFNYKEGTSSSVLANLSQEISTFISKEQQQTDDVKLELKLLKTKLSGYYTTLNIKQGQINHYQIEEAKYGGIMVPPRLSHAINELREEMAVIESEITKTKQAKMSLGF